MANGDGTEERALLPLTGLDYSPSLSADEQWLVFTSERNGSADLFRMRVDGSGLQQLTHDPAYDDQAMFSPDGKSIAFVSSRGGKAHVWIMDVASLRVRQLTQGSGGDFRPAWSPDGQWIAFTSDRNSYPQRVPGRWEHLQSTQLFVVRADGTGLRGVSSGRGVAGSPRWSPNGKEIVYYETTEIGAWYAQRADVRQGITQIASVDVASGVRKELTRGEGARLWPQPFKDGGLAYLVKLPDSEALLRVVDATGKTIDGPKGTMRSPSWSADGRKVVYHKVLPAGEHDVSTVFSRNEDIELTNLSNEVFIFGAFSPSGDRIAAGVRNDQGGTSLITMDPSGNNRQTLFYKQGLSTFAPAWSPDGNQIAFSLGRFFRAAGRPATEVALINQDGTGFKALISDGSVNGFPSWSPDGKHIVYKKDEHLAILSLADHRVTDLTTPGAQHDNFPQWSPKNDWIAFTSDRAPDGDYRIWLIRPDGTGLRQLTDTPGDGHCIWSPDGEWLVFSSGKMGFKDERAVLEILQQPYGELFMVRPDGTGLRQLTDNQWEDAAPTWRPVVAAKEGPTNVMPAKAGIQ